MRQIETSVFFLFIYDQVGAILKPDFGRMVCKTYIFINTNLKLTVSLTLPFYLTKTKNRTNKSRTQLSYNRFE